MKKDILEIMDNSDILEVESLDKLFPKGDKRRGDALIVCIDAFLRGKGSKYRLQYAGVKK